MATHEETKEYLELQHAEEIRPADAYCVWSWASLSWNCLTFLLSAPLVCRTLGIDGNLLPVVLALAASASCAVGFICGVVTCVIYAVNLKRRRNNLQNDVPISSAVRAIPIACLLCSCSLMLVCIAVGILDGPLVRPSAGSPSYLPSFMISPPFIYIPCILAVMHLVFMFSCRHTRPTTLIDLLRCSSD